MIDYTDAQAIERQNVSPNAGCEIDGKFYDVRNLLHEIARLKAVNVQLEALLIDGTPRFKAALSTPAAAAPQGWRPIDTAPKDGSAIIVWNDSAGSDETCPLCFNWNGVKPERGRLCLYHAHGEGLSYGADGLNVSVWGGGWCDSWEDGGGSLPDWWFRADSEFEVVINPTHWIPLPEPPALPLPNADKGEV